MKLVPIRFSGVQWRHNPREISFECEKSVSERKAPYNKAFVQSTGRGNLKIKGTGELYGSDCLKQFERLFELFKENKKGVLSIPFLCPIYACFESLKIIGEPCPQVLTYSFVFRELSEEKITRTSTVYTAGDGECLWDASYNTGASIDSLLKLNTWVKRPDEDLRKAQVRLC